MIDPQRYPNSASVLLGASLGRSTSKLSTTSFQSICNSCSNFRLHSPAGTGLAYAILLFVGRVIAGAMCAAILKSLKCFFAVVLYCCIGGLASAHRAL